MAHDDAGAEACLPTGPPGVGRCAERPLVRPVIEEGLALPGNHLSGVDVDDRWASTRNRFSIGDWA